MQNKSRTRWAIASDAAWPVNAKYNLSPIYLGRKNPDQTASTPASARINTIYRQLDNSKAFLAFFYDVSQ